MAAPFFYRHAFGGLRIFLTKVGATGARKSLSPACLFFPKIYASDVVIWAFCSNVR